MSVRIIVDSAADLAPEYEDKVIKVPMTLVFGSEEYKDGITISKDDFYKRLENSDILPKTSQIPPADYADIFEQVTRQGDSAVVITVASELSGTWQNACLAAEDYEEISKDEVSVLDGYRYEEADLILNVSRINEIHALYLVNGYFTNEYQARHWH